MTSDDKLMELLESNAPNEPRKMLLPGVSGSREVVPYDEQLRRKTVMSEMMIGGVPFEKILRLFTAKELPDSREPFAMDERSVRTLRTKINKEWMEEDSENRQYYKLATMRRILDTIAAAKKAGKFTACAPLENVLMKIQGTEESDKAKESTDVRVTSAIATIIEGYDRDTVNRTVERLVSYKKLEVTTGRRRGG